MLEHPDLLNQQLDALIGRASNREADGIPAESVPQVRRVVTDVDKRRRIDAGLERRDRKERGDHRSAAGPRRKAS
jgi:hypothetical protein